MKKRIKMEFQKRRIVILFLFMTIVIMNAGICQATTNPSNSTDNGFDAEPDSRTRAQSFTHTVFAEYFTTGWCVYCPSASKNLKSIYDSKNYDFYFVSMILEDQDSNPISQDARERANEFGISGYPTVEFEGGYVEVVGGQEDENNYRSAIETCGDREVPDIDITLTATHQGDAKIKITAEISNNDGESYSGTLRIYVAEIVSRYLNYDGDPSNYGFLDFAEIKDLIIQSGQSSNEVSNWDGEQVTDGLGNNLGDINPDNIIIFATMSNSQRATALERNPESSKALNLYFIDEAAAAYLSEGVEDDTKPPNIEMLEPQPYDELSGTIRIDAVITDEGTVGNVDYQVDNSGVWTRMYPLGPGDDQYFAFWDTGLVQDGMHNVTVRAIDLGNNVETETVEIIVTNYANDNIEPTIEFSDLEENQKIMASVSFTVVVTDDSEIEYVRYKIDEESWKNMNMRGFNKYSATINTSGYSDGIHTITINARDRAGNTKAESIVVQISNNPSKKSSDGGFLPGFEVTIFILGIAILLLYFSKVTKKK